MRGPSSAITQLGISRKQNRGINDLVMERGGSGGYGSGRDVAKEIGETGTFFFQVYGLDLFELRHREVRVDRDGDCVAGLFFF